MLRSVPRWQYLLICLVIIIVVGGVVFFSARATRQTPSPGAATATPHSVLVPIISPTAIVQARLISPTPTAVAGNKTVFLIMMENHNWSDIKNNPSAPYINHTLLPMASYAEQYFNPPGNHPSEPNYLWLEAGTNFGIYNDADPYANHQSTSLHLVTLLNNAHISWKSYQEGISGTDCPLTGNGLYDTKHNPMVFFNDVTNSNDPNSSYCIAHVRPYSQLLSDLQHNTQAHYNFITPNLCNDMHDTCAPLNDSVKQGDSWLAQNLPAI